MASLLMTPCSLYEGLGPRESRFKDGLGEGGCCRVSPFSDPHLTSVRGWPGMEEGPGSSGQKSSHSARRKAPGLFSKVGSQGQDHDEGPSYILTVSGPSQGDSVRVNVLL